MFGEPFSAAPVSFAMRILAGFALHYRRWPCIIWWQISDDSSCSTRQMIPRGCRKFLPAAPPTLAFPSYAGISSTSVCFTGWLIGSTVRADVHARMSKAPEKTRCLLMLLYVSQSLIAKSQCSLHWRRILPMDTVLMRRYLLQSFHDRLRRSIL